MLKKWPTIHKCVARNPKRLDWMHPSSSWLTLFSSPSSFSKSQIKYRVHTTVYRIASRLLTSVFSFFLPFFIDRNVNQPTNQPTTHSPQPTANKKKEKMRQEYNEKAKNRTVVLIPVAMTNGFLHIYQRSKPWWKKKTRKQMARTY